MGLGPGGDDDHLQMEMSLFGAFLCCDPSIYFH